MPLGGEVASNAAAAAASAASAAAHAAAAAVMNQPVASVQASTETMEQVGNFASKWDMLLWLAPHIKIKLSLSVSIYCILGPAYQFTMPSCKCCKCFRNHKACKQPGSILPISNALMVQVLRQQLDMLQHQVSQLSMHRQHWHHQQQEQAAIAASAEDTSQGASSSTHQASTSQQTPADEPPAADGDAHADGQQNTA